MLVLRRAERKKGYHHNIALPALLHGVTEPWEKVFARATLSFGPPFFSSFFYRYRYFGWLVYSSSSAVKCPCSQAIFPSLDALLASYIYFEYRPQEKLCKNPSYYVASYSRILYFSDWFFLILFFG